MPAASFAVYILHSDARLLQFSRFPLDGGRIERGGFQLPQLPAVESNAFFPDGPFF